MELLIFALAAFTSVASCILVIFQKDPVRAALFLVMAFFSQAILFVLLSGLFIAALQIIIYAGAIMILFLFIIMLLNLRRDEFGRDQHPFQRIVAFVFAGILAIELVLVASRGTGEAACDLPPDFGSVESIGELLFTKYLLPFEATSMLLMAAILGAVVLAKKRLDS